MLQSIDAVILEMSNLHKSMEKSLQEVIQSEYILYKDAHKDSQ
jgi:hypothetical protein